MSSNKLSFSSNLLLFPWYHHLHDLESFSWIIDHHRVWYLLIPSSSWSPVVFVDSWSSSCVISSDTIIFMISSRFCRMGFVCDIFWYHHLHDLESFLSYGFRVWYLLGNTVVYVWCDSPLWNLLYTSDVKLKMLKMEEMWKRCEKEEMVFYSFEMYMDEYFNIHLLFSYERNCKKLIQ